VGRNGVVYLVDSELVEKAHDEALGRYSHEVEPEEIPRITHRTLYSSSNRGDAELYRRCFLDGRNV